MKKSYINTKMLSAAALSLLAPLSALVATSCTFEQEDYFDESAALRVTHVNEQLKQRLVEQSDETQGRYGWVINYFVAGTDDYDFEGFNLFGRFYESGKVTLAGNHRYLRNGNAGKYTEHSSNYEILSEEGPVLSFNTWNDILTVFEDPVDPSAAPGVLNNDGEGMNGDHNLVFAGYSDEAIDFRGERHSSSIRFVPADRPWDEYIEAINKTKADIAKAELTSYYVTNGTDTMFFSGLNRGHFNYCDRVVDPLVNTVLSCVFTLDGLRLNQSVTLGDNTFRQFTILPDSTALVSENGDVKLIPTWDTYIPSRASTWTFDETAFNEAQQQLWNEIDAELKKYNKSYSIASIGYGKSTGGGAVRGLVVTYYLNARKSSTNTAGLALSLDRVSFGKLRINSTDGDAIDNNMKAFNRTTELEKVMRQFAATLNGTYTVVPDNYFLPTAAEFTPDGQGTPFKLK